MPAWVPAAERKPAPGSLLLVQSFVNTLDGELGTDVLADTKAGSEWLRQAGLIGAQVTAEAEELRAAREFREAIRAMISATTDGRTVGDDDGRTLESAVRGASLTLGISPAGQVDLASGPPGQLRAGLLSLLLIIRDAQRDGSWARLKVCGNSECRWAFYDRSHSRRGAWCDMATCGNLIKNRNLRARRSTATIQR